jgi:pilus assembly protein CpaF
MAHLLDAVVRARLGCLISGGTGAGKTTLLNALSASIPTTERLVTIEDSAELILQNKHRVRLETRPPNTEGKGEITQRDLVRNSLRMRPDRIIVGEVRGAEVWDMLQAMNTGHEGSLTTIHANSARDALARLEMMVAMSGIELPISVIRQYIASGIRVVVHAARLAGGPRRVTQVSEIAGIENDQYVLKDVFAFEQTDVDANGIARGEFMATGYEPEFLSRLKSAGISLPDNMFVERRFEPKAAAGAHASDSSKKK